MLSMPEPHRTSRRRNITEPDDAWTAYAEQAHRDGYGSLSEWISARLRQSLDSDLASTLGDRPARGGNRRPKRQAE